MLKRVSLAFLKLSQARSRLLARKILYKYVLIFQVYVHAASNFLFYTKLVQKEFTHTSPFVGGT